MKRMLTIVLSFGLALSAGDAFAAKKKKKKKKKKEEGATEMAYKAAYGAAGCGLGSVLIKSDGMIQILAATLNGTSASQTFGMTTGTSNCKPSPAATAMEQEVFIESNLTQLKEEAAQGSGDTLIAFAELLGCDHDAFATDSKKNYDQLYANGVASEIRARHQGVFAGKCSRAG